MSSDVAQGDSEIPVLDVSPADGTTTATLTLREPDGTSSPVPVVADLLVAIPGTSPVQYAQRWTATAPVVYDQAGRWVLHWQVTGTGEGVEDLEVWVTPSPTGSGPTWLPGRSRVAAYVPHRTLARSVASTTDSADTYQFTFDSTTTPPGVLVDRLIADGADWVTAHVTPMHPTSQPTAALLAALWSAVAVERSWPNDDSSLQRANDMEKQMNTLAAGLVASNHAANDDSGVVDPSTVLPRWSFPDPDLRYDYPRYF